MATISDFPTLRALLLHSTDNPHNILGEGASATVLDFDIDELKSHVVRVENVFEGVSSSTIIHRLKDSSSLTSAATRVTGGNIGQSLLEFRNRKNARKPTVSIHLWQPGKSLISMKDAYFKEACEQHNPRPQSYCRMKVMEDILKAARSHNFNPFIPMAHKVHALSQEGYDVLFGWENILFDKASGTLELVDQLHTRKQSGFTKNWQRMYHYFSLPNGMVVDEMSKHSDPATLEQYNNLLKTFEGLLREAQWVAQHEPVLPRLSFQKVHHISAIGIRESPILLPQLLAKLYAPALPQR